MDMAHLVLCSHNRPYLLLTLETLLLNHYFYSSIMKNSNIRKAIILSVVLAIFICLPISELLSQCPMCRMAAESNLENGGSEGKGLNTGILYMLAMPYLLVATLGFIWYRNKKASKDASEVI